MNNQSQLEQFREQVYQSLEKSADAILDLLDALSGQTGARSVAELSLEASFRREYSSVYAAIDDFFQATSAEQAARERREKEREVLRMIAEYMPPPAQQPYWLFGIDTTSAPRRFASTLADRGFVYQSNALTGNKPVTIGHRYSLMAQLPEKKEQGDPPWIVPLVMRRVSTQEKESRVGAEQLKMLLEDEHLPWHGDLSVQVVDSRYSTPEYLQSAAAYDNLVTIVRVRSNRTFYRQPPVLEGKRPPGHPLWYGEAFKLDDPRSWPEPDAVIELPYTSQRGRSYTIRMESWDEMLMRGQQDIPMHSHPFTLVQITWLDADGQAIHQRPMWLIVLGERRQELSLAQIRQAYAQRYDLEHFFRFGKQRLLLTGYQTPDVEHEENWWQIVQLAYLQLWLARFLVEQIPRPWERYLPQFKTGLASPSVAQRGFGRIIRQFGTPAQPPKPRGYSPGRVKGVRLRPRERAPVVKKTA